MRVITNYPVAIDSPDHIFPFGTAENNTTDLGFIDEIENYFGGNKIKTLDVGCAGGQLTVDFHNRGHLAIGIEGSDYSVITRRANWPNYYDNILFTCDATKPYEIVDDNDNRIIFDLITSWEVVEHIHNDDLSNFFSNMTEHMNENSIFCASIAPVPDVQQGHILHQSVYSKEVWMSEILPKYFSDIKELPFNNKVRYGSSFHVMCKK